MRISDWSSDVCSSDLIGDGPNAAVAEHLPPGLPVLRARLEPRGAGRGATDLAGKRVYAFAGIGRPEKFFDSLRRIGAELAGCEAFADHQPYDGARSEERRVGKECVSTCRSRWSPYP